MSNWLPDLTIHPGPKYRAIVDAIAADVSAGRLAAGTRMPTHRDLAWRLKVTVGTVARAYAEAERQGLLSGEVGRGTFVTDPARSKAALAEYLSAAWTPQTSIINLAVNRPGGDQGAWAVGPALAAVAARPDLPSLLSYNVEAVSHRHRQGGRSWLVSEGVVVPVDQVSVMAGSQQALVAAVSVLTRPGDAILVEEFTYPGFKSIADLLGRPLIGVAMDEQGLLPDEVERGFARGARLLYTTATVQNPTTVTMPSERRRQIAAAARHYDAYVIEDGVHRFLAGDAPEPLRDHMPERGFYLTTLSKSVSPGLRTAFAAVPPRIKGAYDQAVAALSLAMPVPLIEAACLLIEAGTAREAANRQCHEARLRAGVARRLLGIGPADTAFNIWLPMAAPWTSATFIAAAAQRGIILPPTESFAVGRPAIDAVRVSLTSPPDVATLERALVVLAELLSCTVNSTTLTV